MPLQCALYYMLHKHVAKFADTWLQLAWKLGVSLVLEFDAELNCSCLAQGQVSALAGAEPSSLTST